MFQDTLTIINKPEQETYITTYNIQDTLAVKLVEGTSDLAEFHGILQSISVNDILTAFTAIIAVLIAVKQNQISRHQIKVDLFDKRVSFYDKYRQLLITLIQGLDNENITNVYTTANELSRMSIFLFDSKITNLIDEYHGRILKMRKLYNQMHGPQAAPVGPRRNEQVDQLYDNIKIVESDLSTLEIRFSEHMKLVQDGPWYKRIF